MGALAGGAAGGYGGHKIGHGVLGAIGGAAAGSLAEDAWKKHRKEEQERHDAQAAQAAGNFHGSSKDIRLEDRCTLVAECLDANGRHVWSSLDLNECFTNENGHLKWTRGGNFAASSREIRLVDGGHGLECECGDGRGGWLPNKIWLPEKIQNDNGMLRMVD